MNVQRRSSINARVCGMVQYVLSILLRRVKYVNKPMISSVRVLRKIIAGDNRSRLRQSA
jgi:hypothetical protein